MKTFLWIFLLICLMPLSQANESELISSLNLLGRNFLNTVPDQVCNEETNTQSNVKTCIQDLCGTSGDSILTKAITQARKDYVNAEVDQVINELRPLIEEKTKNYIDSARDYVSKLENAFKENPEIFNVNSLTASQVSSLLAENFESYLVTQNDGDKVEYLLFDPYSELTLIQNKIFQEIYLPAKNSGKAFSCESEVCLAALASFPGIRNLEYDFRKLKESLAISSSAPVLSKCKSTLKSEAMEAYYKRHNKSFLERVNVQNEKFILFLSTRLSSHSVEKFKIHLKNTPLHLNYQGEPGYHFIKESLQNLSTPENDMPASFMDVYQKLSNFRIGNQVTPIAEPLYACHDEYFNPNGAAGDAIYLTHTNTIVPEIGEQIYLHELGHILSEFVQTNEVSEHSKKQFLDLRKCVMDQHEENVIPLEVDRFSGDSTRVEEEMSDFLASTIAHGNPVLRSCNYFVAPHFEGDIFNPFEKKTTDDEYSGNIQRLVFEVLQKKLTLPWACQALVNDKVISGKVCQ